MSRRRSYSAHTAEFPSLEISKKKLKKKTFQKLNGQILKIKKSLQKSNEQILEIKKFIREIKRTNFGNQKIISEIKTYKKRIKT